MDKLSQRDLFILFGSHEVDAECECSTCRLAEFFAACGDEKLKDSYNDLVSLWRKELKEVYSRDIKTLKLPTFCQNSLREEGVKTIGDLCQKKSRLITRTVGLGRKGKMAIENALDILGLKMK